MRNRISGEVLGETFRIRVGLTNLVKRRKNDLSSHWHLNAKSEVPEFAAGPEFEGNPSEKRFKVIKLLVQPVKMCEMIIFSLDLVLVGCAPEVGKYLSPVGVSFIQGKMMKTVWVGEINSKKARD